MLRFPAQASMITPGKVFMDEIKVSLDHRRPPLITMAFQIHTDLSRRLAKASSEECFLGICILLKQSKKQGLR